MSGVKITPAPGRMMWYYPAVGEAHEGEGPLSAQIAWVSPDGTRVNASVLNPGGVPFAAQNVLVVQEGEAPEEGVAFVTWMPYQIGQAKAAVTPAPVTDLAGNVLDIKPGVNQPAADPNAANGPS